MRKTFTWATVALLLVACLNSPVISRSTPFPEDDPNADHPWGGESAKEDGYAGAAPIFIKSTGIPSIDLMNRFTIRWITRFAEKKRQRPPVITDTGTTTVTTTQTVNTTTQKSPE